MDVHIYSLSYKITKHYYARHYSSSSVRTTAKIIQFPSFRIRILNINTEIKYVDLVKTTYITTACGPFLYNHLQTHQVRTKYHTDNNVVLPMLHYIIKFYDVEYVVIFSFYYSYYALYTMGIQF